MLVSVNTPADMPAIQSMSNMSIVSMRLRSSRSVPARISRLRSSSGRTACASLAKGSSSRIISFTPTNFNGTICTENPDGSERVELPSCGTVLPRTAMACGTTWYMPPFLTIVAPFARSSSSSVDASDSLGMPVDVRMVTVPPTAGSIV